MVVVVHGHEKFTRWLASCATSVHLHFFTTPFTCIVYDYKDHTPSFVAPCTHHSIRQYAYCVVHRETSTYSLCSKLNTLHFVFLDILFDCSTYSKIYINIIYFVITYFIIRRYFNNDLFILLFVKKKINKINGQHTISKSKKRPLFF
jgi:hypothetical protein